MAGLRRNGKLDAFSVAQGNEVIRDIHETVPDPELSSKISPMLRRLNPDFGGVEFVAVSPRKDAVRPEMVSCDMLSRLRRMKRGTIYVGNVLASAAIKIIEDDGLAALRPGLEMLVYHELGHQVTQDADLKKMRRIGPGLYVPYGGRQIEVTHVQYLGSEPSAQLYAMNKVRDPVGAIASFMALCAFVSSIRGDVAERRGAAKSLEDFLDAGAHNVLRHWMKLSAVAKTPWRTISTMVAISPSDAFRGYSNEFPIGSAAMGRILRLAAGIVRGLPKEHFDAILKTLNARG